jgi:Ring finger domain
MMDNPNVKLSKAPKLRRRSTSLPGPLSKIRHSVLQKRYTTTGTSAISVSPTSAPLQHLQHSKTNPYVGWFRHAPSLSLPISVDAVWLRDVLLDAASSSTTIWQQHQSKRRRIALNNHCSLKPLNTEQASTLLYIKHLMGEHCETKMFHQDRLLLHKRRGHLRGGGTEDEKPVQDQDMMTLDQFFYDQCPSVSNNESITIKALSRIACWLLDVPLPDERLKSKESRDDMSVIAGSVLSEDEDRSEYSYDNHDTTVGSRLRSNRFDTEAGITLEEADLLGLSSQAEAYYALSAVFRHILVVESSLVGEMTLGRSEIESHVDRLDYDITQMDIVRMNRIASRHLDVESIVRLPILTYSKNALKEKKSVTVTHPPPMVDDGDVRSIHSEEKHDAEFSWMLVPPSPNAESFDNFSVESCQGSIVSKTEEEQPHSPQGDCDSCVICLEPFCLGDRLRLLPCQHSFHVGCIDRWLSGSHSFDDCYTAGCPTCKARPVIIPPSDDVSVDFGNRMYQSDGSVPSWAFARIGNILARDSQHF